MRHFFFITILACLLVFLFACAPQNRIAVESAEVGFEQGRDYKKIYGKVVFGRCSYDDSAPYNQISCYLSDYKKISYAINHPMPGFTLDQTDTIIQAAAQYINEYIDLPFYRVSYFQNPKLVFSAYRLNEMPPFHPFDGEGGTIAHTYPGCYIDCEMASHIFYDLDSKLSNGFDDEGSLLNAVKVTVHEILHFLGFGHTQDPQSIMFPMYNDHPIFFTSDDSLGLVTHYLPQNNKENERDENINNDADYKPRGFFHRIFGRHKCSRPSRPGESADTPKSISVR